MKVNSETNNARRNVVPARSSAQFTVTATVVDAVKAPLEPVTVIM
jgi:hypothetical protein